LSFLADALVLLDELEATTFRAAGLDVFGREAAFDETTGVT